MKTDNEAKPGYRSGGRREMQAWLNRRPLRGSPSTSAEDVINARMTRLETAVHQLRLKLAEEEVQELLKLNRHAFRAWAARELIRMRKEKRRGLV